MRGSNLTDEQAMVAAQAYLQTEQAKRENAPSRNAHGFERVGDALAPLARKLGVSVDVNDIEPSLDQLRQLPLTDVLAADVQRFRDMAIRTGGRTYGLAHQNALGSLKLAEMHHRWGLKRDAIRAGRPTGCACLGDGKVTVEKVDEMRRTAMSAHYVGRGYAVGYCACEDGARRRSADGAAQAQECEAWAKRRLAELFDDITRRQLGEYVGYTLDSYLAALDGYPLDEQRRGQIVAGRLREWSAAQGAPWLYLWGLTGGAKTGLSVALARIMAALGHRTVWLTADRLFERLQATYNGEGIETDVLEEFRNVSVLIVDEVGVAKASDWAERKLTDVLNARYAAQRRTVLVSNLDPDEFQEWAGPRIAGRVFQRTQHGKWSVEADGPNLRVQPGLFGV